jgi:hypothetical protein
LIDVPGGKGHQQFIGLRSRETQFGGRRWFFLDEVGHLCEKLYLVRGQFLSRGFAGLTYRTQSCGSLERIVRRRDKLEERLERGARGKVRHKIEAELDQIEEFINFLEGNLGRACEEMEHQQRRRSGESKERLVTAAQAMRQRQDVPPDEILERFRPLIDGLKHTKQQVEAQVRDPLASSDAIGPEQRPHVDISTLGRLGYVKEGQVLGDQLGWPEDWLPEPERRLFFLIDAREPERACALFVLQDGDRVEHQFFWLARIKGLFGRQEYRFVCPPDGVLSRKLLYQEGRFVCPGPEEPAKPEEPSDSLFNWDGTELGSMLLDAGEIGSILEEFSKGKKP